MRFFTVILIVVCFVSCCHQSQSEKAFSKSLLLFADDCTDDWQNNWMLDGQRAKVINTKDGMELIAGSEHGNDTCHTVLWTKQSFSGNICIAFDYTRTDTTTRCVNILYFHATGKGDAEYPLDIALWNEKRVVPHMYTYFRNMNAYHISYAAFDANNYSGTKDYIRMRRYDPAKNGLKGTEFPEEYLSTMMFKTNVTYHIEVNRYNNQVQMHIQNKQNPNDQYSCTWDTSIFPACEYGRIGLRHMYTRSSRYNNFKVWKLE